VLGDDLVKHRLAGDLPVIFGAGSVTAAAGRLPGVDRWTAREAGAGLTTEK
jgi:hypothetical protein